VFVPKEDAAKAIKISERLGIKAYQAGTVEEGTKKIIIEPLDITFEGESLDLRA
jgi:phosphoribosylformylglycinamidine cyclo-ligase